MGGGGTEKHKKAQIGRRVSPGKGELERTRACVCVRPCVPPPRSAEEMDLCHLGPLMAVYISIYMCTWEGRGDGARTRSPGQICPGWLTSPPPPPLFLPPPTWMLLLNTVKSLICTACQGGRRQPVLSGPSAPAFSRLALFCTGTSSSLQPLFFTTVGGGAPLQPQNQGKFCVLYGGV